MRVPANPEAAMAEGSFLVQVMLPKLRWTAPWKFGSKLTLSSLRDVNGHCLHMAELCLQP